MLIKKKMPKKVVFNLKMNSIDILIGNYRNKRLDIYESMEIELREDAYLDGNIFKGDVVKSQILDEIDILDSGKFEFILVMNSHILIKSKVYPFTSKKDLVKIIKYDMGSIFKEDLDGIEIDYIINDFDDLKKKIEVLYFACKKEKILEIMEFFKSMDIEILYIDHIINTISKGVMEIYKLENEFIFLDINGEFANLYHYKGRVFLEIYKLNLNSLEIKDRLDKVEFIVMDNYKDKDYLLLNQYKEKILSYRESSVVSLGGLIRYGKYFQ